MKRILSIVVCSLSLVAFAAPALADETAPAKPAPGQKIKNYSYAFEDDPLNSNVQGTTGFILKLRPPPARELLARPRVSFVPEMLKSVEGL